MRCSKATITFTPCKIALHSGRLSPLQPYNTLTVGYRTEYKRNYLKALQYSKKILFKRIVKAMEHQCLIMDKIIDQCSIIKYSRELKIKSFKRSLCTMHRPRGRKCKRKASCQ